MVSRLKSLFCVLLCVFIAAGFFSCDALDSPDDSSFGATCEIKGTFLTEDVFPADLIYRGSNSPTLASKS